MAPHISPTGYVWKHLEVHKLSAVWDLTISIIYATSRKMFWYWQKILTKNTLFNFLQRQEENITSEGLGGGGARKKVLNSEIRRMEGKELVGR